MTNTRLSPTGRRAARRSRRLPLIGLLALASVAATVTAARATPTGDSRGTQNGDWIAYSTVPGDDLSRPGRGSDVSVARIGHDPILVASRADGRTATGRSWNVCPAFSPDGTKLAYGTKSPGRRLSVSVVPFTRAGPSVSRRVHLRVGEGRLPPCPHWSADSSRLAYMRGGDVIVRGLDGSRPRTRAGDPVEADFAARTADPLPSPAGDLVVRLNCPPPSFAGRVVVERRDGSGRRVLPINPVGQTVCPYSVAAWSPDGRKLLLMFDVSGYHFTMIAVSVKPPFTNVPVVERVRVNSPHSWPGRGDVSWQSRPS